MKQVTLQSESFDGIMALTTNFLNSNIILKYSKIKIKTLQQTDYWQSVIYYE